MVYRLGKINSLIQSDLDDSDNRIALLVSLKAWAYGRSDDDRDDIERGDGS